MYLTRVEIQNIRAISHLVWEIDAENAAGWHVILGDNGAGKSTFVRGAVLACVGFGAAVKLEPFIVDWPNIEIDEPDYDVLSLGDIICIVTFDSKYDRYQNDSYDGEMSVKLMKDADLGTFIASGKGFPSMLEPSRNGFVNRAFFASFGPFRRFSGGDTRDSDLFENDAVLQRHRTTFSERFSLPDALKWLQDTQFKALEEDADKVPDKYAKAKNLIRSIKDFVNQADFLPHNTRLDKVNSSGVHFVDGNGAQVAAEELSDGYRSVLSLTFELLRLLSLTYPKPDDPPIFERDDATGAITVAPPGVVLIDEVDAHLHPTWQKRIGFWLRKHFPRMQFIVTTHSPLICQAAEKGSIYKLPTPGTDETGRMLVGTERDRLIYGDILDAYSTEAFGAGITRSEVSQEKLKRLGSLNVKEMRKGLNKTEKEEQERLRAMLPTVANSAPIE